MTAYTCPYCGANIEYPKLMSIELHYDADEEVLPVKLLSVLKLDVVCQSCGKRYVAYYSFVKLEAV